MRKNIVVALFLLSLMNSNFASAQPSSSEDPTAISTVEADWVVKTDKTERPQVGSSEATLRKSDQELQFQGELAAIEGNGGLVGFAFVETPLSLDLSEYKYIEFYARSNDPTVVYTLSLKDDQAIQDAGTLTFEQEFVVGTEWTKVKLPLSHFRPKIRGRVFDNFQLRLEQVRSLSFQINRSNQAADSPIPLHFTLDIGKKIYVTNQELTPG
ncbi:CIA30 family protein [Iningainema tapete]|uniref:CIA30 family protein n=1 Tax=Iningainema tapete BLCC-T55 TaxID=2748662 RepID=A0A8J6XM20_9CYAN|nr:CIA30 family protein [Iningainema tapete]MBD2777323.1 CIA30 family protein [Iningainema tapete BLCC-T55]